MSLSEVKTDEIIRFFERHIVYRFGIPDRVTSDNGPTFKSHNLYRFAAKYKIRWQYSTIYNAGANELAKAFNKTPERILKKMVAKNHKD